MAALVWWSRWRSYPQTLGLEAQRHQLLAADTAADVQRCTAVGRGNVSASDFWAIASSVAEGYPVAYLGSPVAPFYFFCGSRFPSKVPKTQREVHQCFNMVTGPLPIPPLGIVFYFCFLKTQEDTTIFSIRVLRGV